jgi:integrase
LRSLTSEEIEDRLGAWSKERKLGPATRNRALAQLSGFLSWAYGRKFLDAHPTQRGRVPKLAEGEGRTRWLRLHELAALCDAAPVVATSKREDGTWRHADERTRAWLADTFPSIVRFGAMTGMRLGEVSSLRRSSYQDDGDGRAFLVTEKTKNGTRLAWPLEGAALDIVRAQLEAVPAFDGYLFPGPGGACGCTAIRRYFPEIVRAAGLAHGRFVERFDAERDRWVTALDAKGRRTPNPAGVTFHVLRHSMASLALNAGTPAPVVQRMGNWKTATMVSRYAHLSDATMREAAGKLATLIGSRQRTVTVTARDTNATTPESAVSDAV